MSGHSKWHNIKLKKAKTDAAKSSVTSKAIRDITLAAKHGGGNADGNLRLKIAVERARDANVSMDSINRAIKRGTGEGEGGPIEELTYEVYGPGGTAIIIEAATDNRNRTASEVRFILSKHNGRLAESGSVSWMFEQKGYIQLDGEGLSEDDALTMAIDSGAEDMKPEPDEGTYGIYTEPGELEDVRAKVEAAGGKILSFELTRLPKTTVILEGDEADKMLRLLDAIEEQDDVSNVYSNFDMVEEPAGTKDE